MFQCIKIAESALINKCSGLIFIFFLYLRLLHLIFILIVNNRIFINYNTLLHINLLILLFDILDLLIINNFILILTQLSIDMQNFLTAAEIKFFITRAILRFFAKLGPLVAVTVKIREAILQRLRLLFFIFSRLVILILVFLYYLVF